MTVVRRAALGTLALSAGLAASPLVGGCASDPRQGYSFSDTHSTEFRTVSVPIFENATFTPGIEAELTEAIIKEINARTPWRVTDSSSADTTLAGVVRTADLGRLSTDPRTGLVQELAVRVTIDFDWRDNRTGKVLRSRRSFTGVDTFVPARGTGERIDAGQRSAIDRLARDVVAELRSDW